MSFRREPYPEDVRNRVTRDYPPELYSSALDSLSRTAPYLDEEFVPWLQLAALRLANGRHELIRQWIEVGNSDWRDLKLAVERYAGPWWEREYILYGERGK